MYDVRFSTDSIFERLAHACHFGVMVGLAVVGPQFDDPDTISSGTLRRLSLILMLSRVVLFFQYSSTLYFSWRYRITHRPLIGTLISLGVAAALYLGLSFATAKHAYIAWYVVAVFEVGCNIAIAGKWHVVSFKGTHLTERMTCLTLIIVSCPRQKVLEMLIGRTAGRRCDWTYQEYHQNRKSRLQLHSVGNRDHHISSIDNGKSDLGLREQACLRPVADRS